MNRIAILGHGKMGRGIYSLLTAADCEVCVYVRTPEKADKLNRQAAKRIDRALRAGDITAEQADHRRKTWHFTSDPADLADRELVVESIAEDITTKQALLATVEPHLREDCILATNTSTLGIATLASGLRRPGRFCGLHFFHPVQLCGIVEIIRWPDIDPDVIPTLEAFCRRLGRTPLVFCDTPGSAINSILACYYCEGLYMLAEGVALPSAIDRAAERICRIGPCESLDAIGVTFFAESFERMRHVHPPALYTPDLLARLLSEDRTGKQSGVGLYRYIADVAHDDAPEVYRVPSANTPVATPPEKIEEKIRERLFFAILCGILFNVSRNLGSLSDMGVAAREVLVMDDDPVEHMRGLGRDTLTRIFERMYDEVGPRFDPALLRFADETR